MFYDKNRMEKRLHAVELRVRELEDTILTVSTDCATLRTRLASLIGSYAVGQREKKKNSAEKLLGELLGGKVIAMSGDDENGDTDIRGRGTTGDGGGGDKFNA